MGKPAVIDEPRSPERAELAQAIARHQRAIERVERIESLSDVRIIGPAHEKLEVAKAALAKAIVQDGQRTVASLLGEHVEGISVEDAEMRVDEAKEELKIFERTRSALDAERRAAEAELEEAKRARLAAIQRLVKTEGGMDRLLAQFEAAKFETERQREVLSYLSGQNCLPHGWDAVRYYPITGADATWRRVFKDLERDPGAPLLK